MCKAMGLPRSTFYFRKSTTPKKRQDGLLAEKIRSIQTDCRFTIGRRRMSSELSERYGISVGENQARRVMRAYHLQAVTRQKTSAKPHAGKAYQGQLPENLLNREFQADRPLTKLVSDVTYIPYYEQGQWHWGYLSVVQDLFDRSIIAWVFDRKQDVSLSLRTLQILSFKGVKPGAMFHSDRGSIYTAQAFRDTLAAMGMVQSYSRSGNCHDNATMECFNGTLKVEALYNPFCQQDKPSFLQQNQLIAKYIDFYNNKRPCSVLGNQPPNKVKKQFFERFQNLQVQ